MKRLRDFVATSVVTGVFVVVPVYLAVLLLLKGMQAISRVLKPLSAVLPDWLAADGLLAFVVLLLCFFVVGVGVQTRLGRAVRERMEVLLFARLPGYDLFRSLTLRLSGSNDVTAWKPALVEIEDALAPAFVIEELDDGRYTVFVPSIPTPFAGTVYILARGRVHLVDVPFTEAIKSVSRWGSGSKQLVAAMRGHHDDSRHAA